MYLIIDEDNHLYVSETISNEDRGACDGGYMSIIDISDPSNPTDYYGGEWHPIDRYDV